MIQRIILLPILLPLSLFFGTLAFFRGLFYSVGIFQTFGFPTLRVVGIGNITSGGTGKTPLSLKLIAEAKRRGLGVSYVSRGFGRKTKGYQEVKENSLASDCGDEALLVKRTFQDVPVAVGEDRVGAAEKLSSIMPEGFFDIPHEDMEKPKTLVIADDSFQHRKLRRDLDVVLIDMTAPTWNYLPLPLGYGREGFAALKRASVVVLTRCESVTKAEVLSMKSRLLVLGQKNVFESRFTIDRISNLLDGTPARIEGSVLLVSSIGNPASFRKMTEVANQVVDHMSFPDHFNYEARAIASIEERFKQTAANRILITEKDAVKIAPLANDKDVYAVVHLKMEIEREEAFYDLIFDGKKRSG